MKAAEFPNELTQAAFRENELLARVERLTAERDALLQQALGVEAERDIARFEIERLTAENERLRAALTEVVFMSGMPIDIPPEDMLANAGATAMTALDPQKYGVDQQLTRDPK